MDGRRVPLFGLGLLVGCAGCVTSPIPTGPGAPPGVVKKEAELPKRNPQPSTCVSYGTLYERMAADPKQPPQKSQELRDKARVAYQQALEIDPNNLPAFTALARYYVNLEDYDRALATYQKALQKHPKAAPLWYDVGMCQS